jgi:hypothetical protein
MRLLDLIKNIISGHKKIDTRKLPTQSYFYPEDFEISIKKASDEDIIDYDFNFNSDDLLVIIDCVKNIVKKNTIFSKKYKFEDLKSVDIIYIFLEVVKFTNNKSVNIDFYNEFHGKKDTVEFNSNFFNYFNFGSLKDKYNSDELVFEINGYKYSLPSIGVEEDLTRFLLRKSHDTDSEKYNDYSYDFLFFLGTKNTISHQEIENLITIFNDDLSEEEKFKVKKIIESFIEIIGYTLKVDDNIIDVKSKLDLEKIWKT